MCRRKVSKNSCWYKTYEKVYSKIQEKYPNMSKKGINYRAWKATNVIFRKSSKRQKKVS